MSNLILKTTNNSNSRTFEFSKMIDNLADLKQLDLKDEYQAACAVVFALTAFEKNEVNAKEMFEYINGPEDASSFDYNFIKSQFSQYPYVMRSYFELTSPDNNYAIGSKISLTIKENTYSRQEENYVQFLLTSTGADSQRMFKLRKKPSTGEWFIFADTYRGLLAGIRTPKESDKWA